MKVVNILFALTLLSSTITYTNPRYKHPTKNKHQHTYIQDRQQQQENINCCTPTNIKNMLKISSGLTKIITAIVLKLIPIIIK